MGYTPLTIILILFISLTPMYVLDAASASAFIVNVKESSPVNPALGV